ncbi:hypothetical protein CUR21_11980 [Pseudorhodobacter sp. MZDSW-24AT]|nr:hypothetical protein CUR21_11980 [Pseudorhodobacter sp. MZDSW-24AT]
MTGPDLSNYDFFVLRSGKLAPLSSSFAIITAAAPEARGPRSPMPFRAMPPNHPRQRSQAKG